MAENKNTVVVYADWGSVFDVLNDDEAGRLIKHFFNYIRDKSPTAPDRVTEVAFEPIKQKLKKDLIKWNETSNSRSETGRLGGIKSAEKRKQKQQIEPIASENSKPKQNEHVNVNVNVNGTVNENGNEFLLEKETKFNFKKNLIDYGFSENLVNDWLIVRKNKKASNTKTAFKSFIKEVELNKNIEPNYILQICCEKSWAGFKMSWIENLGNNGKQSNTTNREQGIEHLKNLSSAILDELAAKNGGTSTEP